MQSLNIPSLFQNPNQYTAEEIEAALRGNTGTRKFSFRYELLDETNKKLRDLDSVRGAKISQNWLAEIKRTATFDLRSGNNTTVDPIDYLKHRIKPWVRLHMPPKAIPDPDPILPPDPPTPPSFSALTDDFETAEKSSVWDYYSNGVNNVGGKLRIPTKSDYPDAASNNTWALTGAQVACEFVTAPHEPVPNPGTDDIACSMIVYSNTAGTNLTIQYRQSGFGVTNKIEFINFHDSYTDAGIVQIEYVPAEHKWLRIYESAGFVYWQTSRTGLPGTWQTHRKETTPAWVISQTNTLKMGFLANGVNENDYAEWDNLNLTPEGVETAFMPQTEWFNNFNGTPGITGEAVTANNSARTGHALDDVLGTAIYSGTHSADSNKSVKLGDDSGTSGGTLVVRLRSALSQWSMRCWFYIQANGALRIQPDGANPNTSNDIVIDDFTNTWTVGTVTLPVEVQPQMIGQLVKLEVITTELLTIYRLFWTDPSGDSPDYVTSESNIGRDPLLTVTVSGGGSTTPPVWFDNLLITEPRFYAPFTDDSVNWVEWPQGVFLLSSPTRESDTASVVSRNIQGYDLAQVLQDDQVPDRFSTANLLRVDDNFSRDTSGSFGTSQDGTVWLHNTVADTAIGTSSASPGFAWIELQANPSLIRLAQAGNTNQEILVDSEIYVRVTTDQLALTQGIIAGAIFRLFSTSNYYRVRLTFDTDNIIRMQVTSTNAGVVTQHGDNISSGITHTAGTYVNFRAQCIGHVMRAKVWRSGSLEPAGWMIEEEVPQAQWITHGYTGVSASAFGGNTNVNPEVRWDSFQLNPNPNNTYTGVVEHLLVEANLPRKITASTASIPVPKEWEAGTNKLTIINEVLAAINYESLSFDEDGFAVAKPYVSPQERPAEIDYRDDERSVIYPDMSQELDLFAIPNRWILTVSDPDRENITVVITNNDPASPTSTVRRGRTITAFLNEQDSSSEAMLIQKASRVAFEASQVYEAIDFSTGLMPIHSGNDVYTLGYDPLGVNSQYSEVQWEMDLSAGAKMSHKARRVITFSSQQDPSIIGDDVIVTGALEAGNIAVGITAVVPVANKPTKVAVTGLSLQGTGPVRVIACAESTVPGSTFREVTTADHTAYGFSIWVYRTTTSSTNIHWIAMRGA